MHGDAVPPVGQPDTERTGRAAVVRLLREQADGLLQKGVGVAADDEVHTPGRVQLAGKPSVLLKADMGEQDRKINVDAVVGVADLAHLHRCGCRIYKGADEGFGFCLVDHVLCDDADEKDGHPIYL